MKTFWLRSISILLLALAWTLQGAKSEIHFALWAAVTVICLFTIDKKALSDKHKTTALLLAFAVFLSQIGSLDFQVSLFWSFQIAVFLIVWPFLCADGADELTNFGGLLLFESLLAFSALITVYQMRHAISSYGLLPINPNFNAAWLTIGAVFLTAKQTCIPRKHFFESGGEILLILVLALLVIFGHSRSGLIALIAGFGYIAWYSLPRKVFLLTAGLGLTLSFLIFRSWWLSRFGFLAQGGLRADRLQFWLIAVRATACRPLTGYGLGNFEIAYNQFAFPAFDGLVRYGHTTAFAHNEFLQFLTEMGIPAGGLLSLILVSPLWMPIRKEYAWDLPAKVSLLVLGITSFVNPILHMPFLVYLGLLWTAILMRGRSNDMDNFSPKIISGLPIRMLWTFALTGLLCLSAYFFVYSVEAAEGKWEQLARLNPYDGRAWHLWGNQRRAVEQSPYNLYFRESFAVELESSATAANDPEALRQYLQALVLCPTRAVDALAIGRILLRAGDPRAALTWFEKAQALEPYYWESDLWIARCYHILGRRSEAAELLKNLLLRHAQAKLPNVSFMTMSPYERAILGFDERVVKRELKMS